MDLTEQQGIRRLEAGARRIAVRQNVQRVFDRAVGLAPIPLGYAILLLTSVKVWRLDSTETRVWELVGLLPLCFWLFGVLAGFRKRRPPWASALALDTYHGLKDRLSSALSFAALKEQDRTPFMRAAIADAVGIAPGLDPVAAAPLGLPRGSLLCGVLLLGTLGLSLLEVRVEQVRSAHFQDFEAETLAPDDLDLFRELAVEFETHKFEGEDAELAQRFNQLVQDLGNRRLDRSELLRRLGNLEERLARGSEARRAAREEGLSSLARELEKSALTKAAGQALGEKRLFDAEQAFRKLAERLKNETGRPTPSELERLRSALQSASVVQSERLKNIEKRRSELEAERQSLLRKKGPNASADTSLATEENRRKLEKLEREKNQAGAAHRALSELDRKLAEAAQNLLRDMGQSAQDLEAGAQNLDRMAREQLSDDQKRELLRRLQELREIVRRQGGAGKQKAEQQRRFSQRAQGEGQGQRGAAELRLGLAPLPGSGPPGRGSPTSPDPGEPNPGSGDPSDRKYGTGHDPNLRGDPSTLKGQTHDVTAAGIDTGQGTASAEVIAAAAEQGFRNRAYKNLYRQYETVAERVLGKEEVPAGYRFYVKRYFQLIRPRE